MKENIQIAIEDMPSIDQPFYTLRQAWILKGCLSNWERFRRYPFLQPKGGHYDGYVGGKGVFTKETVKEWLPLLDSDLEIYHRKYKTGAKALAPIKKGKRLEEINKIYSA